MSLLDKLKEGVSRIIPEQRPHAAMSTSMSGGIGNGAVGFEDDVRPLFGISYFP